MLRSSLKSPKSLEIPNFFILILIHMYSSPYMYAYTFISYAMEKSSSYAVCYPPTHYFLFDYEVGGPIRSTHVGIKQISVARNHLSVPECL